MNFRLVLIAVVAMLLPAGVARAQEALTLEDALARALASHPDVRGARAAESSASARIGQARAGWLPRVDLMEGWQRGDQPVFVFSSLLSQRRFTADDFAIASLNHPDPLSNHRAAVTVEQTLFDGMATRAAVRQASLARDAARLEVDRATADLRLAVARAYGRAVAAGGTLEAARSAVAAAAEDLRRVQARRDTGFETQAAVLSLQLRADEVEARRVSAEAEASVARATLNSLIGAPLDAVFVLREPDAAERRIDPAALEAEAVARRPEVQQAILRRQQAEAARTAARASLLPQVVAQGTAESNGRTFGDRASAWTAGVQARWNVFAGGAHAARLRESAAEVLRAQAAQESIEKAVRLEVRGAVAAYQAAVAREVAGRRMVEQARESHRIIRDRYEAGLAPSSDLLRAAEDVAAAEATRVAATIEIHTTFAALARAAALDGVPR